jgi:hypothetical protein
MKRSRGMLLSWSDRLSMFASRFDDPETSAYRITRARDVMEELKRTYHDRSLSFDFQNETIRGEFMTAIEGDFPGAYMVVVRIASSRICSGPCFLRVAGTRMGGIAVSGRDGIIGIALTVED